MNITEQISKIIGLSSVNKTNTRALAEAISNQAKDKQASMPKRNATDLLLRMKKSLLKEVREEEKTKYHRARRKLGSTRMVIKIIIQVIRKRNKSL